MKKIFLFVILLVFNGYLFGQNNPDSVSVRWYNFDEVNELFEVKQKPVLIFIYSNKNDSCKQMMDSTFAQAEVANYINVLFYPIKIEVSTTDTITFFNGQKYTNKGISNNSVHEIVKFLTGGVVTYPLMVCFDRQANGSIYRGFKDRDHIFPTLIYYAEDINTSTEYKEFEKYYFKAYPPGKKQNITRVKVKWMSLEEALEKNKTHPKRIFLNFYNNWKVSCTVMSLTTYNNPAVAKYLNDNYYPVSFRINSKDTLNVFDTTFINEEKDHGFHQLPLAFLSGRWKFPSSFFFDEQSKVIGLRQEYLTPEAFEPMLEYYSKEDYKIVKWDDFQKNFKTKMFEEKK